MKRIALIALLFSLSAVAAAWWNEEWTGRKSFVFDTSPTGGAISETLTDVPVLLRLHSGNFPAFFEVADGGRDFRFFAADETTLLKHHVETFDPINELAFVWVKLPTLTGNANAQKIWMYFKNPAAPAAADSAGSFDVAQTAVVHFQSDLGQPVDATGFANNPVAFTAQTIPAALIGAGARFDGQGAIRFADSPSLAIAPEPGWTFSAWIKPTRAEGEALIMRKGDDTQWLELRSLDGQLEVVWHPAEGEETVIPAGALSDTGWQQIALVVDAGSLAVYNNALMVGQAAVSVAPLAGDLIIGAFDERAGFVGDMDEIRVASVARPAQWLLAMNRIQGGDSVVSAQADESQSSEGGSGGGSSFFGTILANVSTDGWVVIGLLGIMSVLSWLVMIMKSLSLSRVQADNRAFMEKFAVLDPHHPDALDAADADEDRELAGSPILQSLFGSHDHFQSSNLYRIYHVGMGEMNKRLGRAAGAQASPLTPQAMAAIRSSMDATTVRETQKLNSLMVMLTIAISGGPFLGLLGTVMGVMITFAAIAVSGDVNIDAIAPGVSAALMTTVAGLFVAIPALFGYNYLTIRIRDMTADMYVFVDELEAKIGEFHT